MDAALRHKNQVSRLECVAPALDAVADGIAAQIHAEFVKRMVVPVDRLAHCVAQVEQMKILVQIAAFFIARLLHCLALPCVSCSYFTILPPSWQPVPPASASSIRVMHASEVAAAISCSTVS